MTTLQVGGLSSSVGRFGSDCITLFLYKLWCLSSTCEVSNTDSGVWGVEGGAQGCKGVREGDYRDSKTSESLEEGRMCSRLVIQMIGA